MHCSFFCVALMSLRVVENIGCFLWTKSSIRGTRETLFTA